MEYRGKKIHYTEWITWNKKKASSFVCYDFNIHPYNISQLPGRTLDEIKSKIDNYLDNYEKYVMLDQLNDAGAIEFYKQGSNYKGD